MPRKYEDKFFVVDTPLNKQHVRVSFFNEECHYQDEIELKYVPEEEIVELLQKIEEIYNLEVRDD